MLNRFIVFVFGVVFATLAFYQLPFFPDWRWVVGLSVFCLGWVWLGFNRPFWQSFREISFFVLGGIIGLQNVFWQSFCAPKIPNDFLNQTVQVSGQVVGLPKITQTHWRGKAQTKARFVLVLSQIKQVGSSKLRLRSSLPLKQLSFGFLRPQVRLNGYQLPELPRPGQNLILRVKLKANHASLNPGGFDYEAFLFQHQWVATGYVRKWLGGVPASGVDVRFAVDRYLTALFKESPFEGLYLALLVGDRSHLTSADWSILQRTGTIHLMAISGLHMGIVAGLGFWLFAMIWGWLCGVSHFVRQRPRVFFGATGALLFATFYMVLAGASLPTQRAWLMVVAVLLFVVQQRQFQPWTALSLAGLLVVLWHPASVLSSGLWLSFMAVALIFASLSHPRIKPLKNWQKALVVQAVLSLGLVPLVAFAYQQVPVYESLANLIAIPFVSLIGLPLLMLVAVLSPVSDAVNGVLIPFMDQVWSGLWMFLRAISDWDMAMIPWPVSLWQVVLFYGVVFWGVLHFPTSRVGKIGLMGAGVLLGISFIWPSPSRETQMILLDVGQGLSMVVVTPNHTIIYDTGGYWSPQMDGGKLAVLPYLKHVGRSEVDLLIVSHSDGDHAGGARSILEAVPIRQAISGQPSLLNKRSKTTAFTACVAGQTWQFDDLTVRVLSPMVTWPKSKNDNDTSCVVQFSVAGKAILATGDLSQRYERYLVKAYGDNLQSQLLVAGHHGSKTSSSASFLTAVDPQAVLFSAGYLNQFHFPHPSVIHRVEQLRAIWWNTACEGAIGFVWHQNHWQKQESFRQEVAKWYHHRCLSEQKGRFFQ